MSDDVTQKQEAAMKRIYWLSALVPLVYGCDATRSVAPDSAMQPNAAPAVAPQPWVQEIVIDYGPRYTHAGPGPHPTTESDRYSLLSGGIRWFGGGTVEYRITGTAPTGGNTAVEAGEQVWDAMIAARTFTRNDGTSQTNPCTDLPSTVAWAAIDGPGGILGVTAPCYNLLTKEIVGFSMTLDTGDSWDTSTSGTPGLIDVGNVATHEFGHVVGLGHVNAPRDGCLTMYKFATDGEIQKRTPGLGDKLGMAALYGNTNTSAGACGA
jgi:hypothetical protein